MGIRHSPSGLINPGALRRPNSPPALSTGPYLPVSNWDVPGQRWGLMASRTGWWPSGWALLSGICLVDLQSTASIVTIAVKCSL